MASFIPSEISVGSLHGLLLSSVAPRPIAFASTIDAKGRPNLSPFSFFNVFSANPPVMIFSPARRVRDNTTKHTLTNVEEVEEVVINVVNFDIVQQMSLSSTEYPDGVNEFEKAGLTMLESDIVRPFRVAESPVQFECKVTDIIKLGTEGGAGNLVICEVLKMHVADEVLNAEGQINQEALDLVARAGGSYYSRANKGFFEIPKPLRTLGIGVDAMPEFVRDSMILTGNDLGMLGNVEQLPSTEEVQKFIETHTDVHKIIQSGDQENIHKKAQEYLVKQNVNNAWKVLLATL